MTVLSKFVEGGSMKKYLLRRLVVGVQGRLKGLGAFLFLLG